MPHKPSGKFVLRVPPSLHTKLKMKGIEDGLSLNQVCCNLLACVDMAQSAGKNDFPESRLISVLKNVFKNRLKGLILFGSAARGETTADSDVDFLIVLDNTYPLDRTVYRIWDRQFAPNYPAFYTPHFVRLPDNNKNLGSLWYEAAIDGIILFDEDQSVIRLVQGIRRQFADGAVKRKWVHGHPYWTGTVFEE